MSIFGKIRNAKKAADDHRKSATVAPAPEPEVKRSYKHVPTHAAQDALSGSSSQLSTTDLVSKIKEQRRRASELGPLSPGGLDLHISKLPPSRQRSAGDLSITSVMQQQQKEQFEQFQASQLKIPDPSLNPYRFNGAKSSARNRMPRNMSNTSLSRAKSPLSNTISGIPNTSTQDRQKLIVGRRRGIGGTTWCTGRRIRFLKLKQQLIFALVTQTDDEVHQKINEFYSRFP
jgi:hypothetical protein